MYQIKCEDLNTGREWFLHRLFDNKFKASRWLQYNRLGGFKIYTIVKAI